MKVIRVFTKNGRITMCEMALMGAKTLVHCRQCIQIHCPMSNVEVIAIKSASEVQSEYNQKHAEFDYKDNSGCA